MSTEIRQSVTSRKSDIPGHFIAISSFGCHKGNTDKKASEEYKALYHAWCDERISGIKLMKSVHDKRGQIFVDPADAERVIAQFCQPKPIQKPLLTVGPRRESDAATDACELLGSMGATLDEIFLVLERLTAAVESIATQPKTEPAGTWRGVNGECL